MIYFFSVAVPVGGAILAINVSHILDASTVTAMVPHGNASAIQIGVESSATKVRKFASPPIRNNRPHLLKGCFLIIQSALPSIIPMSTAWSSALLSLETPLFLDFFIDVPKGHLFYLFIVFFFFGVYSGTVVKRAPICAVLIYFFNNFDYRERLCLCLLSCMRMTDRLHGTLTFFENEYTILSIISAIVVTQTIRGFNAIVFLTDLWEIDSLFYYYTFNVETSLI